MLWSSSMTVLVSTENNVSPGRSHSHFIQITTCEGVICLDSWWTNKPKTLRSVVYSLCFTWVFMPRAAFTFLTHPFILFSGCCSAWGSGMLFWVHSFFCRNDVVWFYTWPLVALCKALLKFLYYLAPKLHSLSHHYIGMLTQIFSKKKTGIRTNNDLEYRSHQKMKNLNEALHDRTIVL